jgi:transcriptional regulator with PAS, ATPase and Fis domain
MLGNFITKNTTTTSSMNVLSPNQLLQVNPQAITPNNPGDLKEIRTCKVERNFKQATKQDAQTARVAAAKAQAEAKLNEQYYRALAKHEKADSRSQTAYRRYQGAQAGATYSKVAANAQLGKTLYSLAPQYAKSAMSLGAAGEEAAMKFAEYQATYHHKR